jgi:hypothetical protein
LNADEFCPAPGVKTRDIKIFLPFRGLSAGQINAKKI